MGFKLGYSTLRWQTPDLEPLLLELKEAGWGRMGDAPIL